MSLKKNWLKCWNEFSASCGCAWSAWDPTHCQPESETQVIPTNEQESVGIRYPWYLTDMGISGVWGVSFKISRLSWHKGKLKMQIFCWTIPDVTLSPSLDDHNGVQHSHPQTVQHAEENVNRNHKFTAGFGSKFDLESGSAIFFSRHFAAGVQQTPAIEFFLQELKHGSWQNRLSSVLFLIDASCDESAWNDGLWRDHCIIAAACRWPHAHSTSPACRLFQS